jgi:acyl-CoA synthetase (AMP-forming)/AMP-acid ligase II
MFSQRRQSLKARFSARISSSSSAATMDRDQPRVRRSFFRAGDVVYQDLKGYLYILDRQKDMIVTGGENVYCGEAEPVIFNPPAVREVAVFGIPDLAAQTKSEL